MQRLHFILATSLLSFLITSCSKISVPLPTPLDDNSPKKFSIKIKWQTKAGNGDGGKLNYNLAPDYSNDMIFVANENGQAYALAITDGKVIWKNNTGMSLSTRPNTVANAVMFGSVKGNLIAINRKNGKILWQTQAPSSLFARPTIYNNYIYTQTHDGSVTAFDIRDGSKKWSVANNTPEVTLPGNSSPIVVNDTVIVGSAFGKALGFTAKDGNKTINMSITKAHGASLTDQMVDITANPMLYDKYLIFATYQGSIIALDKDSTKVLWTRESSIINNITINNNAIFTVEANSQLKALRIKSGKTIWSKNILRWRRVTAPTYYKGLIVVADYQGYLHFFNSLNGQYLGRYELGEQVSGELIATKNGIIIQSKNGTIYLVDVYSNKVKYSNILSDYKVSKGKHVDRIQMQKKSTNLEIMDKNSETTKKDRKTSVKAIKSGISKPK